MSDQPDAPVPTEEAGPAGPRPGVGPRGPAALDPPMVPFAVAGLAAWAIAGLAMLPFRDRLTEAGHGSWPGICLAGFLVGIPGLLTMIRHDANRRRRRQTR